MRFSNTLAIGFAALAAVVSAATFTNPLKNPNGSDPFIVYDGGYYYLTTTTWTDIQVTRATTLEGLKTGENKVVWEDSNTDRCCQVWAPEMHSIDGTWYMYYTAGRSDADLGYQRSFVLKGEFFFSRNGGMKTDDVKRRRNPMGHVHLPRKTAG